MLFCFSERSSVIPNTHDRRLRRIRHAQKSVEGIRERHQGRALVLKSVGAVGWATGGLGAPVDRVASSDPVWVLFSDAGASLIVSSVELSRLESEYQPESLGFSLIAAPWYEEGAHRRAVESVTGRTYDECLVDGPDGAVDVTFEVVRARLSLSEVEREVMAELGLVGARAVEGAVGGWRPGKTADVEIAANVQGELERNGADAVCLIVGGDQRVRSFRHPVMTGALVESFLMVVVVARTQGLHVALTRLASTTDDAVVHPLYLRCQELNATVLDATRAGVTWASAYTALGNGYRTLGQPDAWREHFQGGPIGYGQREFELAPSSLESEWWHEEIPVDSAVAWNPSFAGGAKVEDTYFVGTTGVECVTDSGSWPRTRGGVYGADLLVVQ